MVDHKTRHDLCGLESPQGDKCVLYKNHISLECQTNHGRKKWKTPPIPEAQSAGNNFTVQIEYSNYSVHALLEEIEKLKNQIAILKRGGSIA